MIGDLLLPVSIPFNSLKNHLSSPCSGSVPPHIEQFPEGGSIRIPLASGDLEDVLVFPEVIGQLVDEIILSQKRLPPNLGPDGLLPYPPVDELPVLLLCLSPLPVELAEHPVNREARMRLCFARGRQVAGPFPFFRLLYHFCPDRVQDDISADLEEVAVFLDKDGFVPSLKQMTCPTVAFVEELGIDAVQLSHAEGEIAVRGLDEKVEVIGHEAVGVADPIVALINVLEDVQEVPAVGVVLENRLFLIAPGGNVINGAWIFDAKGTGHDER